MSIKKLELNKNTPIKMLTINNLIEEFRKISTDGEFKEFKETCQNTERGLKKDNWDVELFNIENVVFGSRLDAGPLTYEESIRLTKLFMDNLRPVPKNMTRAKKTEEVISAMKRHFSHEFNNQKLDQAYMNLKSLG
jgi:hypothetical protein